MSTILEDVLEEEYARSLRSSKALQAEIERLPKGYIRKRGVRGHDYYYLQWREGKKVRSQYVRADEVERIQKEIDLRHKHEQALKDQKEARRMIVRALGRVPS